MGKWNYRRWTRKNYNQPPPPSPPNYFETEFKFRDGWKNTNLPWEERFCLSVGIPWQKVVIAKRYMNCHENVSNWNDSGGEEAFYDAKKRFWSQINGLPCNAHPVPDPNAYIDDVDWNLEVNPDLMLEVDREYFNPDESGKVNKQNCSSGWDEIKPSTSDNPWESSREPSNGAGENVGHGWGLWDKSRNLTSHNPWEDGNKRDDGETKDNNWGSVGKLWGRTSGANCANSWGRGDHSVGPVKQTGKEYTGNRYSAWENNDYGSSKSRNNNNTSWNNQAGGASESKQWNEHGDNSSAWKMWENQYNASNYFDHRWRGGSDRSGGRGGCLKREGSQQYNTSRYKSSRIEDYGIDQHWKKQRNPNRLTFE